MFTKLKRLLINARVGLFTLSSGKKVGRFAIVMILFLDVQVLYSVLSGASRAGESAQHPVSLVPTRCESVFKELPKMQEDAKLEFVASFALKKNSSDPLLELLSPNNWEPRADGSATDAKRYQVADACKQAHAQIKALVQYPGTAAAYDERARLAEERAALQIEISELKSSYDSALLEKIAGQKSSDSILPSAARDTRAKIESANARLEENKRKRERVSQQIIASAQFVHLVQFAQQAGPNAEIARDNALYARAIQLYPVKSLGLSILFLLPLLIVAIVWNRRAKRRDAPLQTMASSHMILIALLPILFHVFYFIYELIPHTFFTQLFDLLAGLHLEYIWNYVAIIGSVLMVSFVIWVSQRFVFNSARKRRSRIKHSECIACEEKLSSRSITYCYFCGASQISPCRACGQPLNRNFLHCDYCGAANTAI